MSSALTLPTLDVKHLKDRTLVKIVGCDSLNEYNSDVFGRQLATLAAEANRTQVTLDLEGITYATSSALGKFVGLHRALRLAGRQLVLTNPSPAVAEALIVTRLYSILDISPPLADEAAQECLSA